MKKTFKIFATVVAIVLAISSIAFVTAFAAEAEETVKPTVVSANIRVSGDFGILLAIDADTVKGGSVTATFSIGGEEKGTFSDSTTEKIPSIDSNKDYYVVETRGIAPKDMHLYYTYVITDAEGNTSDTGRISVAEYLYTRLFVNETVNAEEGTKAYAQREFYFETLEFGAKAQNLFYNNDSDASNNIDVLVNEMLFVSAHGASGMDGYDSVVLSNKASKGITLAGDGSVEYSVKRFTPDATHPSGYAATVQTANGGAVINITAHTVVTLVDNSGETTPPEGGETTPPEGGEEGGGNEGGEVTPPETPATEITFGSDGVATPEVTVNENIDVISKYLFTAPADGTVTVTYSALNNKIELLDSNGASVFKSDFTKVYTMDVIGGNAYTLCLSVFKTVDVAGGQNVPTVTVSFAEKIVEEPEQPGEGGETAVSYDGTYLSDTVGTMYKWNVVINGDKITIKYANIYSGTPTGPKTVNESAYTVDIVDGNGTITVTNATSNGITTYVLNVAGGIVTELVETETGRDPLTKTYAVTKQ